MKKIHLLAAVLLLGGVSCLHVKRERMDNGTAFSWWPSSNTTQLPTTPLRAQAEPTASSSIQPALLPDKRSVVVGGRMEKSFDHPADNSVRFIFEREPDAASTYVLEYELYGAAHAAELSSGWNDEPNTGASRFATRAGWVKQRELIHPSRLQRGENVLRFNRLAATDFYELRNIRLTQTTTPQSSVLVSDAQIPVYDSTAVLRVYLAQDAQLWVAGVLKELKKGYHVVETKLDKREGSVKLRANMADGSSEQWELTTVGITNAAARQQQAIPTAETVLAKPDVAWLYEGSYVNLTAKAGAVTEEVNVKIQALRKNDLAPLAPGMINVTAGAAGYRLLPDNIRFNDNIRLSLRIDSALVPQGFSVAHVRTYYFDEEKRSWTMLPQDSLEKSGLWAGAYTDHFTDFINAIIKAPELPGNQAHVPTSFSGLSAANPLEGINQIAPPSANAKGDLNLSFPIEVPKGRNGMEPALQLVYNSSGGNGYFGLGWNMNFPNIQVDTRWGVPRYLDGEESEAYLVNGEQLDTVGHQLNLRTRRNDQTAPTKKFSYRVEGKFDSIVRYGTHPTNYAWIVYEKTGKIYYYGCHAPQNSTSPVVVDPNYVLQGPKGIAYWALAEVVDPHGNRIVYEYHPNPNNAVKTLPVPKRIIYSEGPDPQFNYYIDFMGWEDRPTTGLIQNLRPDATIDMRYGFPVAMDILIRRISVVHGNPLIGSQLINEGIRTYFLNYRQGAFGKMLLCTIAEMSNASGSQNDWLGALEDICDNRASGVPVELPYYFRIHRFSYHEFDNIVTPLFSAPQPLGGTPVLVPLQNLSESAGNLRSFGSDIELLTIPTTGSSITGKGTLNQSRTLTFGGNLGVYAGVGGKVFTKNNSLSGSVSGSRSFSKTTVGFFDIDGDGYPDRVYKSGNTYQYQPVRKIGNTFGFDLSSGLPLPNLGGIATSTSDQWSWNAQGQAIGVFVVNFTRSYTTSLTTQYFSDVDADGYADLVDGSVIKFNRKNPNGNGRTFVLPTSTTVMIDECNSIEQTGHVDPDLGKDFSFPSNGMIGDKPEPKIEEKLLDHNTVSVWVAPRAGTINISSLINIREPDHQRVWEQSYANGVYFCIQHNSNELVRDSLYANDFGANKQHQNSLTVNAGDLIFFRLLSKGNRDFDDVIWEREISYSNGAQFNDADGLPNAVFNAGNDYLPVQALVNQMPFNGNAEFSIVINSTPLSDTVYLQLIQGTNTIINQVFPAGQPINFNYLQNHPVLEGEEIKFELTSQTKVDYSKLDIQALVNYREATIDNQQVIFDSNSEWAQLKITPHFNLNPLGRNFHPSSQLFLAAGTYNVSPELDWTGIINYTGDVILSIKRNGVILKDLTLKYTNGAVSYPNGTSFDITLSGTGTYHFCYNFSNPVESNVLNKHNVLVKIGTNGATYTAGVFMPYNAEFGKFGTLYRGWGQFIYSGDQRSPIDVTKLNSFLESQVQDPSMVTIGPQGGELNVSSTVNGVSSTPATASDMQSAFGNQINGMLDNSFYRMFVNPKTKEWYAPGSFGRVWKNEVYNTNRLDELATEQVSNPVPIVTSTISGKAILKKSKQKTDTWGVGLGPSVLRANGTRSTGTSRILADYRDMNGDGYPDNMSWEKIQYTNPRGGLNDGGSADFPRSFNEASSSSLGGNLGGGAKVWSNKSTQSMQATSGFISAVGQASGSAGVSVGGGENLENFGLFDMNGDGLPDMVVADKKVILNNGYGFEGVERDWNLVLPTYHSKNNTFGGDGALNLLMKAAKSRAEESWTFGVGANTSKTENLNMPLDINGDGLLDLITFVDNGAPQDLYLNLGTKFELFENYNWGNYSYNGVSENTSVSLNLGGTAGVPIFFFKVGVNAVANGGFSFNRDRGSFVDVNNDGYVDYVEDVPDMNNAVVFYNQIGKTNLLSKVELVTGATYEFDYTALTTSEKMPKSKWLFTQLRVDDKFSDDGNQVSTFQYSYNNPNYNRFERTFLGFDSVTTNQLSSANGPVLVQKRERYHNENIYFSGMKYRESVVQVSGSNSIYWVINSFNYLPHDVNTGAIISNPLCADRYYPALFSEEVTYTEGTTTRQIGTKKVYYRGPKGLITKYEDHGDLGDATDDLAAFIEYTQHAPKYIYGLASRIVVRSGFTNTGAVLRERKAVYNQQGRMTSMQVLLEGNPNSGVYATDSFEYDLRGNITKHLFPANAQGQRYEMTYVYDARLQLYPVSVTDVWGLTSSYEYDHRSGKVRKFTDAYGQITDYHYGQFYEIVRIVGPKERGFDFNNDFTIKYDYWWYTYFTFPPATNSFWAQTKHYDHDYPDGIRTVMFTDGLGQQLQVKKSAYVADNAGSTPNHRWINSGWQEKDGLGRIIKQYHPTTSTMGATNVYQVVITPDNVAPTEITYDFLNRPILTKFPDGTTEVNVYDLVNPNGVYLMSHFVRDHANNSQQTLKDVTGNVIQSNRNLTNVTKYAYSPIGELLSTTDPDNFTTTYSYDKAGRLTRRIHPDAGFDAIQYDPAGNVIAKKRNRQHVNSTSITYGYHYNRLTQIEYPENSENNVYYEYGQSGAERGRVQRIEDGSGAHEFAYGNMGEVIRKTTTLVDLNDLAYTFSSFWEYDSWGRIKRLVYPDGEEVNYSYDAGGKLIQIKAANGDKYLDNVYYDKFENKLLEDLGNDTRMEFTYSSDMRRLSNLKAFHQNTAFLDVNYTYDVVGNITSISNRAGSKDNIGGTFTHNYTYDNLYRLASANGSNGSANYQLQMGYSASGNITNKAVSANVNDLNNGLMNISYMNQYSYNPAKPHQITNITDQNTNNSFNFEWDDNGNMTLHNEMVNGMTKSRRMCWDEENRMILSADEEQMAGYVYDAGGMRTHKASGTVVYSTVNGYPNSFATVSAFTLYPSELITVSSGMYTKHYYNGSSRIASRIGGGFNQHNDLNNYSPLTDHVQLQNSNDYTNKAQQLRNVWSRNASCAGLDQNLEYAYSLELNPLFANPQPDGERYFYHSDHLGSSAYITTENGYATQFLAYMPFGETLSEQQNSTSYYSPFKFSAKEKDPETGYSYFGARYYSPELSVWLGVDPMSDKYPSLSAYNYCALNPVMLVDPDGRQFGEFLDENGKKLGNDGKSDNKVYVIKTSQSSFVEDGKSVPGAGITKSQAKEAKDFVKGNSGNSAAFNQNPSVYDSFVELPGDHDTRKAMADVVGGDNGRGGTSAANNREYGGGIMPNGSVVAGQPGPIGTPLKGAEFGNYPTGALTLFHSHPSGSINTGGSEMDVFSTGSSVGGQEKTTYYRQSPSPEDISNAGDQYRYVFGRGGTPTVYIYNNRGVVATLPQSSFVKP